MYTAMEAQYYFLYKPVLLVLLLLSIVLSDLVITAFSVSYSEMESL